MKKRTFKEENYSAIFFNNKTLRFAIDPNKPIQELKHPEFYDVKVTNQCEGGCSWCYQNSVLDEKHDTTILEKFYRYFSEMNDNQKPFQIAFGGGEPTSHPDFCDLLALCSNMGIVPNYTTNGMFIQKPYCKKIIEYTKKYCGGVALSTHSHLNQSWTQALFEFQKKDIKCNLHIIISDEESLEYLDWLYNMFYKHVEYFVLLPYEAMGRAKTKELCFDKLFERLKDYPEVSKISYGANFYESLKKEKWLDVSLYEPEIFSKYLDLTNMKLYKSSFNLIEVK